LEIRATLNENRRLLNNLSAAEHNVNRQNKWIGEAVNVLDVQKKTIKHIEVSILKQ